MIFILVENYNKRRKPTCTSLEDLSFATAFKIGIFQVLSVVPGTSRSGSTIIGGILVGTSRTVAAEFTFFLAIPVMFGASLLKLVKFGFAFTPAEILTLVTGVVVAFFVSVIAIKFLMGYIKSTISRLLDGIESFSVSLYSDILSAEISLDNCLI